MINVERIAQAIAINEANGIIIHTIPSSQNWLVCTKIEKDRWKVKMCNPLGKTWVELETITNNQHENLLEKLTKAKIKAKVAFIKRKQAERGS